MIDSISQIATGIMLRRLPFDGISAFDFPSVLFSIACKSSSGVPPQLRRKNATQSTSLGHGSSHQS